KPKALADRLPAALGIELQGGLWRTGEIPGRDETHEDSSRALRGEGLRLCDVRTRGTESGRQPQRRREKLSSAGGVVLFRTGMIAGWLARREEASQANSNSKSRPPLPVVKCRRPWGSIPVAAETWFFRDYNSRWAC